MSEGYDKERTAALIEEAQQITAALKVETASIKRQMENVLEGGEYELLDAPDAEKVADDADLSGQTPPKSFWRFWR